MKISHYIQHFSQNMSYITMHVKIKQIKEGEKAYIAKGWLVELKLVAKLNGKTTTKTFREDEA